MTLKRILFLAIAWLMLLSSAQLVSAEEDFAEPVDQAQAIADAQATLASLFSPNATMPLVPSMKGTVALPSSDSKNITIDEDVDSELEL